MKFEKVKYTAQYEGIHKTNEWISIDVILEGDETPEMGLDAAKQKIEGWQAANNGYERTMGPIQKMNVDRSNPQAALESDINSCTDLKVLETYRLLVKDSAHLQGVYKKKHSELSK